MILYEKTESKAKIEESLLNSHFISKLSVPLSCKKLIAFTLAEVLITLLIIGVVASLVIPALIANTQDAELHTAWKKVYADLDQVAKRIMMDNGGTLIGAFPDASTMMNSFLLYLNYNKACYIGQAYGNCWHRNDGSTKYMYGAVVTTWDNSDAAILNNSTLLLFTVNDKNCSTEGWGNMVNCGRIVVDVNGFKKPNIIGKDINAIWVVKNGIKPLGDKADKWSLQGCSNSVSGWGCAAQYLYQ